MAVHTKFRERFSPRRLFEVARVYRDWDLQLLHRKLGMGPRPDLAGSWALDDRVVAARGHVHDHVYKAGPH
eukprot:6203994-Prymnesium_polylepis.1